jgi:hypothetical protein
VNEVTRYSPDAYELENKNRLDIFSSALYGYDNSLSIGVSSNASYNESGVADFETIQSGGAIGDFMKVMSQTNLNFDNNHAGNGVPGATETRGAYITEQFTIKRATVQGSKIRLTVAANSTIPADYINSNLQKGNIVGLSLTSRKNAGILGNLGFYFNGRIEAPDGTGDLVIQPFLKRTIPGEQLLPTNGIYHGVITFFIKRKYRASSGSISYVHKKDGGKAHTGKRSMLLSGTNDIEFDQPKLKLEANKKYILSFWVSRSNEDVRTYKPVTGDLVKFGKLNSTGSAFEALTNAPVITYGKVVEGWQKVDVEFIWSGSSDIPVIGFVPGGGLYVDDIRVSPKTGGILTYVYDLSKFWLTASLNADNYATLYYYDEEGNLHVKKQETEKGIFTLNESRGHVSKNF